jgi:hypothetical protein
MLRRVQMLGVPMLFLCLTVASGCDHSSSGGTAPSSISAQPAASIAVAAQPTALRFEPAPDPACLPGTALGARLVVVITGNAATSLRRVRFGFVPDGGTTVFPAVIPIPGPTPLSVPVNAIPPQAPLPTPGVAPLPTSMPIPLPEPQRLPFFASFGCGSFNDGVLVVSADFFDRLGAPGTSELRARVTH